MTATRSFTLRADASADKVRGGYYTPEPLAEFVARWVAGAGPRLLEPSCGDGRILRHLAAHTDQAHGVELVEIEAAKARVFAPVDATSLFDWLAGNGHQVWDGVAGNPPYISFGNWPPVQREPALDLMRVHGLDPNKLTNAWVPFVVASTAVTRPGGRVGLVLPAELLQVGYAAPLRDFLVRSFTEITLVAFERLVFDGALVEVVVFCGVRGDGPARVRTVRLDDTDGLDGLVLDTAPAPVVLHEHEKWTRHFLEPTQVEALRDVEATPRMNRFRDFGAVEAGILTGCNDFFTFSDAAAAAAGVREHCVPLVGRSAQLTGLVYDKEARDRDLGLPHRTWLLNAPGELTDPALAAHVAAGETAGVHRRFKCSIRDPWWSTPSLWVPDLFLAVHTHLAPRFVANTAGATVTSTILRVRANIGVNPVGFAAVFYNSVTFAFAEVSGRSYGGGVLNMVPREVESLPIPSPSWATGELIGDVDRLLRAGDTVKALDLVDHEVLVKQAGLDPELVARCRDAWVSLRDRRMRRSRR